MRGAQHRWEYLSGYGFPGLLAQRVRNSLRSIPEAKLRQDARDVMLNRSRADVEAPSNLGIRAPFGQERQDLRLALVGAPFGIARRPPLLMLPIGFPLIGQRLGRYLFSNATRDGSRKFWGQVIVKHPERVDDLVLDVDVAHTRRNVESMLSLIASIADWRRLGYRRELILGERWRALTMPTLLLWPEHDAFGSPEKGEALVATNPNLRLVRIPAAGHNAWFDDPESVVAEIERFLATQPRSGVEAVA